jgi:hypothetical protein
MYMEGEKVMIMQGERCGHFATVCSSDDDFTAIYFNNDILVYLNDALKPESECVFTEDDLGGE